jgi:hypothetical protein
MEATVTIKPATVPTSPPRLDGAVAIPVTAPSKAIINFLDVNFFIMFILFSLLIIELCFKDFYRSTNNTF